jgi:uridine kinase
VLKTIIAVTGASGAGKSHFSRELMATVRSHAPTLDIAILTEDAYYRDQAELAMAERERVNYDHPDSIEHELLLDHLLQLRGGQPVDVPVYDYSQHTRSTESVSLAPVQLLIVEGILLFTNPLLRRQFDLRLFVDTPLEVCLQRRMDRDCRERGRSEQSVQAQFEATVKPMYHEFIAPAREHAHLQLDGTKNSSHSTGLMLTELQRKGILP